MPEPLAIGAYYYPGWHPCPVRDEAFPRGWSEWNLVYQAQAKFAGHEQPNIPLWGRTDDSDPESFTAKIDAALAHGVDPFIFAFYWSRGRQLLQGALNKGFLTNPRNQSMRFALMWANRMPRKVLPVKDPQKRLIDPGRLVYTDSDDFLEFVQYIAREYFVRENYFRLNGACYLSIFDTSFFLRQMGLSVATQAIMAARAWLRREGFGNLHLAAIDPIPEFQPHLREIGFDSVTHYVWLPAWKGDYQQEYAVAAREKAGLWATYPAATGLPYVPSVSPGWDATPRGSDYGPERPQRYPWWPVVVRRDPKVFAEMIRAAGQFAGGQNSQQPLVLISSWNEWSEGHYLEPDRHYGFQWLEAVKGARD